MALSWERENFGSPFFYGKALGTGRMKYEGSREIALALVMEI